MLALNRAKPQQAVELLQVAAPSDNRDHSKGHLIHQSSFSFSKNPTGDGGVFYACYLDLTSEQYGKLKGS